MDPNVDRIEEILEIQQQPLLALQEVNKLIEQNPNSADYLTSRGNCLYRLGEFNGARQNYERAVKIDPNHARATIGVGLIKLHTGKPKAAIPHFNRALELGGQAFTIYYHRSIAYADLNKHQLAIEDLSKAIELEPNDAPHLYLNRSSYYYILRQYRQAVEDATKTLELKTTPLLSASAYFNRACAVMEQYRENPRSVSAEEFKQIPRDLEAAFALYKRMESVYPGNYKTHIQDCRDVMNRLWGMLTPEAHFDLGLDDSVLQPYDESDDDDDDFEDDDDDFEGDLEESVSATGDFVLPRQKPLDIEPNPEENPEAAALHEAAEQKYAQGLHLEALASVEQAIAIQPNFRKGMLYVFASRIYQDLDKPDESIAAANQAIEMNSLNPRAYGFRAMAMSQRWKARAGEPSAQELTQIMQDMETAIQLFERSGELEMANHVRRIYRSWFPKQS